MRSYNELVYWNNKAYGKALRIPSRALYSFIALMIPVIIPLPFALIIPKEMKWRY